MKFHPLLILIFLITKLNSQTFSKGESIEISWKGEWYKGKIVEVKSNDNYLISYDGYDATWNESVGVGRIRKNSLFASKSITTIIDSQNSSEVYFGKGSTLQIDISKDGKKIFSAGNTIIHVVDANSMKLIKELNAPGKSLIHFVDYNETQNSVLAGCASFGAAVLYDLETGKIIWEQEKKSSCWAVHWIPNSNNAVIASSPQNNPTQIDVEIWDLKEFKKTFTLMSFNTNQSSFGGLTINNNIIALALVYDNSGIYFYEHGGKKIKKMEYKKQINALKFVGANNNFVFANDDKQAFYYLFDNLTQKQKFNGIEDYIQGIAVDNEEKYLVLGGGRTKTISAYVYEIPSGKLIKEVGNQVDLLDIAFLPNTLTYYSTFNYNDNFANHKLIIKNKIK